MSRLTSTTPAAAGNAAMAAFVAKAAALSTVSTKVENRVRHQPVNFNNIDDFIGECHIYIYNMVHKEGNTQCLITCTSTYEYVCV